MQSAYTFPCAAGRVRPVRLSEATRKFAFESLNDHKYGKDALTHMAIVVDDLYPEAAKKVASGEVEAPCVRAITGDDPVAKLRIYDEYTMRIAEEAPLRVVPGEYISGAATWGLAIRHYVPVLLAGKPLFYSTSHMTQDFWQVITKGVDPLIADARKRLEEITQDPEATEYEIAFVKSVNVCYDAMKVWHKRYLDLLATMPEMHENYEHLQQVPFKPARNFKEAVQSLWFAFAFLRLMGNWPGIGRIDEMLGPYLKKDLAEGTITLDEAREYLSHFFIKGCEWITGAEFYCSVGTISGDAQHYQNIILSGIDKDGNDVTNEVSYLVLDIIEELSISDFPTSIRVSPDTDPAFLRRACEVTAYGGGVIAFYNEPLIINAFLRNGYPLEEARCFTNDGCWEVQIPGKTFFRYWDLDIVQTMQQKTFRAYKEPLPYETFEELYAAFKADMNKAVEHIQEIHGEYSDNWNEKKGRFTWDPLEPATTISLFEHGCLEKACQYWEGGPIYNIMSPHMGGLVDAANSLYAIKVLCFDKKLVTLNEMMEILGRNWEGAETLRLYARNKLRYWGNDNDEVDMICARILDDFDECCRGIDGKCGFRFPAGVSTFGRQIAWAQKRLANPCGTLDHEVLSANMSPAPGTDYDGATAIIRSYCKSPLVKMGTGAALDIRLLPSHVKGEEGVTAIMALVQGFVTLGGCFMQPDIVDPAILEDAKAHPENYQTLSVRVSGWNARFVTLAEEWQDCVINEAKTSQ